MKNVVKKLKENRTAIKTSGQYNMIWYDVYKSSSNNEYTWDHPKRPIGE